MDLTSIIAPATSYRFILPTDPEGEGYGITTVHNLRLDATDKLRDWGTTHNIPYDLVVAHNSNDHYVNFDVHIKFRSEADLVIFKLCWEL